MGDVVYRTSPTWKGYQNLRYLMIFGDSYSDVGYLYSKSSFPTDEAPLGIEFPGITWAEPAMPNWVGYLITEYSPGTRLLVYDYAIGGDNVAGVRKQVQVNFLPRAGEKPDWANWGAEDSLFVTWVGINDCALLESDGVEARVAELIQEQESLYNAGARNFLFIDIPPINRTPVGSKFASASPDYALIYEFWNEVLRKQVAQFTEAHPDASVFLFSSWDTFTRVLDDPITHGFGIEHVNRWGGEIWVDNIHPTSKMHDWIAHDISRFLNSLPGYIDKQAT